MTNPNDTYTSPLAARNASPEMLTLWSPRHKFNTWRRIWLAVAEAQHEVTKDWPNTKNQPPLVSAEQVAELRAVVERGITDEELTRAGELERDLRHDVMAHVHCLGERCPKAKSIIHLGMTSQDVVCNADLITLHKASRLVRIKLARAISATSEFASTWAGTPTLGFTHYQPAQPVTVGRRAALWASDMRIAHDRMQHLNLLHHPGFEEPGVMELRGVRGATGTEAALLALGLYEETDGTSFDEPFELSLADAVVQGALPVSFYGTREGYHSEPEADRVADGDVQFYFNRWSQVMGQTYPRVVDTFILADLASTAAVLHKIATDIRLLSNRKELDEPFGKSQIGSSAMPYKRNPMKCERICGLTRFVMNLVGNAYDTAATQWLERTLDDSSNRRLSLPEAFLALDGALDLMHTVASGLVVHEAMVRKNLMAELPFMATENILMACVKLGADRQDYHERIRVHAQKAGMRVKQEGLDNDLLDRLKADPAFQGKASGGLLEADLDWDNLMDPMQYIGRSVEQTERFIEEVVEPLREQYADQFDSLESSDRGV